MMDGAGHDGASDFGMGHGGHADLGVGGHGDLGGHGGYADIGHGHAFSHAELGHGLGHGFGFGFHDFDGHGHGGHVTAEALMVSHSHCHSGENFGHVSSHTSMGHLDHGHLGGWSTGDGIDKAAFQEKLRLYRLAVEKAKTDPNRRYYGAHVLGHGYVDVQALFAKIAGALGAQRFCNRVGNFNPVDLVPLHLTDWDKYAPPYSRQRPPAGWFPKANGLTYVFKQYWQVSRPVPWFWPVKPPQGFDRSQNTYFEISLITWFYADIGDYETRLDINVVSIPVLDQRDQQWGYRATPLQRHQKVAAQICEQLFTALKNNLPSPVARERRAVIVKMIDDAIAAKRAEAAGKAPAGATPAGASSTGSVSTPVSAASSQGGQANASTVPNLPAAPASGADLDSVIGTSVDDGGVASGAEPGAPAAPSGDLVDAGLPDGGGDAAGSSAQAAGTATVAVRIPAPRLKER